MSIELKMRQEGVEYSKKDFLRLLAQIQDALMLEDNQTQQDALGALAYQLSDRFETHHALLEKLMKVELDERLESEWNVLKMTGRVA